MQTYLPPFFMAGHIILIVILVVVNVSLSSAQEGTVYYVAPTTACHTSSSCPHGEVCHPLDNYINNSGYYFSPDKVNITLFFMCGVHNQTTNKCTDIHDLQKFTMASFTGKRDVTINMPVQRNDLSNIIYSYTFSNVSCMTIESITINFITATFVGEKCNFTAANAVFYGSLPPTVSVININHSRSLLDNCTFHQNVFIRLYSRSEIQIKNCNFQSYYNKLHSAVYAKNSTVSLFRKVYFINNRLWNDATHDDCGAAIYMDARSILIFSKGAVVYFTNNSAGCGGALSIQETLMEVQENTTVTFFHNKAYQNDSIEYTRYYSGGALYSLYSSINIGAKASSKFNINKYVSGGEVMSEFFYLNANAVIVNFSCNTASSGGAVNLWMSSITINRNAAVYFINNSALHFYAGALWASDKSTITIDHGLLHIYNNFALNGQGGAFLVEFNCMVNISNQANVTFSNNTAIHRGGGGAVYVRNSEMLIKNATLQFVNNVAHRGYGGAIVLLTSTLKICEHANVSFINNTASDEGGAIFQLSDGNLIINTSSILILYNNSAYEGGAIYTLIQASMVVGRDSLVRFTNNSATDTGGAIYTQLKYCLPCFLFLTRNSTHSQLQFQGNRAKSAVGMHIYGASIRNHYCTAADQLIVGTDIVDTTVPYCGKGSHNNVRFISSLKDHLSPVSSDPLRVCLCDTNGRPQCTNIAKIFVSGITVIPGEMFSIPMVVVGQDFGVTTGKVYAGFLPTGKRNSAHRLHSYPNQTDARCSRVNYTIYSSQKHEVLYLQTTAKPPETYGNRRGIENSIKSLNSVKNSCIDLDLLETPVFINITLLGCPKGFTFQEQLHGCKCYSVLIDNQFNCVLTDNKGYLNWNNTMWVGPTNKEKNGGILFSQYCPLSYCDSSEKSVQLDINSDSQCASNRAGILCGSCKENYSLAIGSSQCIQCSNDRYLALFTLFVAAGFLLVSFVFALNLTVSKGLINGLVFYANIVWTFQNILFSRNQKIMAFFHIFIAWLNLDFGIETCLIVGLTAFWKTWLQFLFPLYIWTIAGGIVIACHYSTRITNFVGERAVPLLATLLYLSYTKLLRTVVIVFGFVVLGHYPDGSKLTVWYVDGNLPYCQHPHIYLFIFSLVTVAFLCIPFTVFLLLIQCWMRISNLRPLRWINKFTPVYDACFAPLNDNHRHLFGALLLIRGILLALVTLTEHSTTQRATNLLVLFVTSSMLLLYVVFPRQVYKSITVKILESYSLVNLIILSGLSLYLSGKETIILEVSIGFAFGQFCIIVLISLFKSFCQKRCKCSRRGGYQIVGDDIDYIVHERVQDRIEINENMVR